jgi:NAD(P)-dependent dehydrogenase (short-subunit alcohol dehydrogenase family)
MIIQFNRVECKMPARLSGKVTLYPFYNRRKNMDKPVMIIAGASRGLGAGIAQEAAKMGANLVLAARSLKDLEAVAEVVRSLGSQAVVVRADLTHSEDCERVVNQALHHFERVDALVNNLGRIHPIAPLAKATAEDWHANLAVNLVAPALMIEAALPLLRQSKGRVINVSSGAGERAYPGWGVYCTAKAGLNMLTQVQAQEEPDITLVAVKPGVVDTEMQAAVRELGKAGMPESSHAYFVSLYEKGKLLAPDVPGKAIAFLALNAPHAWSGECLIWNDEKVKALMAG